MAYFSTPSEGGWLAYPVSAVYTSPDLRAFREWLPATSWAGQAQLSGSFVARSIEDYYLTPYDMGLGRLVKFDHDFIGREALEGLAYAPQRRKVTLVWDKADVAAIHGSLYLPGTPYKYIEMPVASYGFPQADEVRDARGDVIGMSGFCGYSGNEAAQLSIAVVSESHAEPGTEVTVIWGEPDGGTAKSQVEKHRQYSVRATVAPAPYAIAVQRMKRSGIGKSAA